MALKTSKLLNFKKVVNANSDNNAVGCSIIEGLDGKLSLKYYLVVSLGVYARATGVGGGHFI